MQAKDGSAEDENKNRRVVFAVDVTTGNSETSMSSLESLIAKAVDQKCKVLEDRATAAEEQSRLLADRLLCVESLLATKKQSGLGLDMQAEEYGNSIIDNLPQSNATRINERVSVLEECVLHFELSNTEDDTKYSLPEDTYTLLMTEDMLSAPFAFAMVSVALSILCLALVLVSAISKRNNINVLGFPEGSPAVVHIAQFTGLIVGLLREDEIPEGLTLMALGVRIRGDEGVTKSFLDQRKPRRVSELIRDVTRGRMSFMTNELSFAINGERLKNRRIIIVSLLRICVGYLFLLTLFINVAQNDDVIQIFYDLLALEFVENIDNMAFALGKRGFFGMTIMLSTRKCRQKIGVSGRGVASGEWPYRVARLVYFVNAALIVIGMAIITRNQNRGLYRCQSLTFNIGEDMWEEANILKNGSSHLTEKRLLIYTYFSGIYVENGTTHDGYPRYTEQNKIGSTGFVNTIGAEFVYCKELSAWVFRHPQIKTSVNAREENECSWLLRSPTTFSYNIAEVAPSEGWQVWKGMIDWSSGLSVSCNECTQTSDCSYHGECGVDRVCRCNDAHYGYRCELELPCAALTTEKRGAVGWDIEPPISLMADTFVYNRPVYLQKNLTGIPYDLRKFDIRKFDDSLSSTDTYHDSHYSSHEDFADWDDMFGVPDEHDNLDDLMEEGYSVIISFTGSRWYGTMIPVNLTISNHFHPDYHAFWDNALSENRTFIISDLTSASSPLEVDWFEMRRRINYRLTKKVDPNYGPIGVLIPLLPYKDAGWFHCLLDQPTNTPSISQAPTKTSSPSHNPTISVNPTDTTSPSQKPTKSLEPATTSTPTYSDTSWNQHIFRQRKI